MALLEYVLKLDFMNWNFFIAVVLLVGFIILLALFFFSSKPGPNPFAVDCMRTIKPLEMNANTREKVLKQGFQAKDIPEDLDAVVIGSGIGGLTAAAILAKAGKRVLVLEQHDQAGGCCHTFVEKGFEFDVGIHYVGEMRSNSMTHMLINQITEGQLEWCDLLDDFDLVSIGLSGSRKYFPFNASGSEAFKNHMLKLFPKEEKALNNFIRLLRDVRKSILGMMMVKVLPKWIVRLLNATGLLGKFTSYFQHGRRTLQQVMDELTDDPDLKAVLSYSWGDYGTDPCKGSFALHASLINHYLYGASYPKGGASQIAYTIIPVIERAGGRVLVRAPVSSIIIENGKAVGVRVNRKSSGTVDIRAKLVISDAGAVNTFCRLLTPDVAKLSPISRLIGNKVEAGVGCISLFVGLDGTSEQLNVKPQNIWAYTSNDFSRIFHDYLSKPAADAMSSEIPVLFISFPSSKDPTFNERYPGKTVCTIITLANWEWFKDWEEARVTKRGEEYNALKVNLGRRMWDQVLDIYPHLADKVEYFEVGSPITNNYYIGSSKGEIYGLDHTAQRFGSPEVVMHLRADTEIPNLLLTGQDVLCCGFTGAMFGGLLCASKALERNLYNDLLKLRSSINKGN